MRAWPPLAPAGAPVFSGHVIRLSASWPAWGRRFVCYNRSRYYYGFRDGPEDCGLPRTDQKNKSYIYFFLFRKTIMKILFHDKYKFWIFPSALHHRFYRATGHSSRHSSRFLLDNWVSRFQMKAPCQIMSNPIHWKQEKVVMHTQKM